MTGVGTVSRRLWTIGHWTCPTDVVLNTLASAAIELLVDVRKTPGSRRSPQFGADQMQTWLNDAGVEYLHLTELSGRRPRQRDVDPLINAGWRNPSFKNYADYTLTAEFEKGLERLTGAARDRRTAIICGEPMPWRCHRLLIANTLSARGWAVLHLLTAAQPLAHELGRWGAVPVVSTGGVLTYPADAHDR